MNIKRSITLISLLLCCVFIVSAQDITKAQTLKAFHIKGKVISEEDKQPVMGATVLVKGTSNGVASDFDGQFEIYANVGDVLIFSSIGFVTLEHKIKNEKELTISLKSDTEALTEITVVGYGVQERRDLTGSISSVKAADIDKTSLSFDNAISGKISGVQISSSSGAPGGATSITIRGISSLNANSNNPLIVIDGVPVYGTDRRNNTTSFERTSIPAMGFGGTNATSQLEERSEFERNPLSMLNPNDIESIEVLKDAYATAIYGSRGAAGVILITTKNGSDGKARINVNYSTTFSDPIDTPSLLSAQQYSDFYNLKSGGNYYPALTETNWLDKVLRTGITNNVNASIAAGNEKMKYYFSFSSLKQGAYIDNQDYEKYNSRINVDYKLTEKLKMGTNVTINFSDNSALNSQSIYRNAVLKAPNIAEKTDLGTYYFGFEPNVSGQVDNPLAQAHRDINYVKDNRVIGKIYFEYKPISWLTLKSEAGVDNFSSESYSRLISRPDIEGGNATQTTNQNRKFVINNTASIVKTLDNIHAINSVIGQSFETSREQSTSIWGRRFHSDEVLAIGQASENGVSNTQVQEWALFSVFARLNYQYNHKYLAGITYRVDGSSRFNKENRYIGFPSFSLGWRASEENFLSDVSWIDELKFRGSVGFTGIDGTSGYYGNQGQYNLQPYGLQYGGSPILEVKQPNNPNLKWERTRTVDLGLDFSILNEKVNLHVDYYHKKITNMLYSSAVPWYMGYTVQQQNIGDMENQGFEIELTTENINSQDFQWTTNFNISRNTNKILKLNFDGSETTGAELGYKYFAEGESAGQFFLHDWHGVDALTGDPLWKYPDGSVSTTPPASLSNSTQYRKPMGDALPDFFGGLTNTFRYKNWKLDTFFSFSYGNQMFNGTKALLMTYSTTDSNNLTTDILDYWKIVGHETDIPRIDNASIVPNSWGLGATDYTVGRDSDRFLEDASYLRLKSISLTYSLPKRWLEKNFLDNVSVYVQANNIWTLTDYTGQDPEVSAFGSSALLSGFDELTMPQSKSYSVGLNVGF